MARFSGTPVKKPRFSGTPAHIKGVGELGTEEAENALNKTRNDDWDYSGIPDMGLRASVSRGDTEEERANILAGRVGQQNVIRDKAGRLGITPEGASKLGIETDGKSLALDGRSPMEAADIADMRGAAPGIAAGTAAALATGGAGAIPAIAATMGAAGLAKMTDEAADEVQGLNTQTPQEVFGDVGSEMVAAGAGEGIARGVIRLGRKALQPNRRGLKDGAAEAIEDSKAIGIVPKVANLKDDPIYRRIQGLLDTVLGDRNAGRNVGAFKVEMQRLLNAFNGRTDDPETFGTIMREGFVEARDAFKEVAATKFRVADDLLGKEKIISSSAVKDRAKALLEEFGRTSGGKEIAINPADIKLLKELADHEPNMSATQWQRYVTDLNERIDVDNPMPGVSAGQAKQLLKALRKSFDNAISDATATGPGNAGNPFYKDGLRAMREARDWYAQSVGKYNLAVAQKLSKPGGDVGGVPDDQVLDFILKKGTVSRVKEIKGFLSQDKWKDFQAATVDRIFDTQDIADVNPLDRVFDGTALRRSLNSFGRKNNAKDADRVLTQVLGEEHVSSLRKLATSMELASSLGNNSGGIVAQAIAVQPIKNFPKIVQMVLLRRFMTNPKNLNYLTEGIRFGEGTEQGAKALARVGAQMSRIADDYLAEQEDSNRE